jgi:hypothetical protein
MTSPHAELLSELPFIVGLSTLRWPARSLQVLLGDPARVLGVTAPLNFSELVFPQDQELYAAAVAAGMGVGTALTIDYRLRDGRTWIREWTKGIGLQRLSVITVAPPTSPDAASVSQLGALAHDLRNVAFLLSTSACSLGPRSSAEDLAAAAQDAQHAARSCTNAGRLLQTIVGDVGESRRVEVVALLRAKQQVARRICDGQTIEIKFAQEQLHAQVDGEALGHLFLMLVARRSAQLSEEEVVQLQVFARAQLLVFAVDAHGARSSEVLSDRSLHELAAKLGGEVQWTGARLEVRLPILRDELHP